MSDGNDHPVHDEEITVSFFRIDPEQAGQLASAYARASGAPATAAELVGQAARDEASGMSGSAAVLRDLAIERIARTRRQTT